MVVMLYVPRPAPCSSSPRWLACCRWAVALTRSRAASVTRQLQEGGTIRPENEQAEAGAVGGASGRGSVDPSQRLDARAHEADQF